MQLGWAGLFKTVAITATLTSAAWLAVGAWWWQRQSPEQNAAPAATSAKAPAATEPASRPDRPPPAPVTPQGLIVPVAGVRTGQLIDTFTQARGTDRTHDAIDIPAPEGAPVIAAAEGRVEKLFWSEAGGNTLYLRSRDGRTIHYYAHLRTYAPGLREGLWLRQGALVGTVGHTGNADPAAPHLHFAVMATTPERKWWEGARALNPYPLLTQR